MINRLTLLRKGFIAGILLALLCAPLTLLADEFRPALLEITEREGGWVDVTWKVPTMGEQVLALTPVMPDFLQQIGPGSGQRVSGAWVETKSYNTGGQALSGATISVDGLVQVPAEVVVRVHLVDGTEHSAILRSVNNSYTMPEQVTRTELAISYWKMGTIHILEGMDHLLFLVTLLLIVNGCDQTLRLSDPINTDVPFADVASGQGLSYQVALERATEATDHHYRFAVFATLGETPLVIEFETWRD